MKNINPTLAVDYMNMPKGNNDRHLKSGVKLFLIIENSLVEINILENRPSKDSNLYFNNRDNLEEYFKNKFDTYAIIEGEEFKLEPTQNGKFKIKNI